MQNKECKKPIESYTVLLECHCRYTANHNSSHYHKCIYKKIMHPKVEKHENKQEEFSFKIPTTVDYELRHPLTLTPLERELAKKLNPTTVSNGSDGRLSYELSYFLKIKVVHKSWNDWAGHRTENIPITIFSKKDGN